MHGGLQIIVWPMKADRYEALVEKKRKRSELLQDRMDSGIRYSLPTPMLAEGMGLAPGGRMRQEIYNDPYGLDAWDQRHASRCFITIANTAQRITITGERLPTAPPTAAYYYRRRLPWFDYYDGDANAIAGAEKLGNSSRFARWTRTRTSMAGPTH
jgi:hypothetical protein